MDKREEQIHKLMMKLNVNRAEAIDILETDKEIDRGAKLFELDPELEAGAKKARQADRKQPIERKPREKKQDKDKEILLNAMFSAILPMCESYEVINAEREFSFTFNGRKFKVTMSCPRS